MATATETVTVEEAEPIVNAMTVDVEDYFHVSVFDGLIPRQEWASMESRVCANTERILQLFDEEGITGTFFVLGWVAERFPRLVRDIAARGHEIASHGFEHRLVYDMTPAAFREDIRRSKALLESASGAPVLGYRAPSYSVTSRSLWALDVLMEEGFVYDASIFPIHHDRYGIPVSPRHPYVLQRSSALVEAPASTVRWGPFNLPIAGGGYFRILPYAWTRWGIRRLNEVERLPAIFYLHPWEIDPDQPRLSASRLSQFRHYRNLGKTEDRLRCLVREFRFSSMMSLLQAQICAPALDAPNAPLPYVW
ncbi:MAG TPA: XrtA system polysaccharide deacetylase [Vicinamibacterales bacterium]|nr:XrtA system polysaccharide deacetylase [Vicinamibacterales bacterium]